MLGCSVLTLGGGSPAELIGRDLDVEFVCGFVDETAVRGGVLLVSGDAGVGKTVLLDVAARHAAAAGTRVVRAVGAEFEAEVSFSGLSHVLHPLRDGLAELQPLYREALSVAQGHARQAPQRRACPRNASFSRQKSRFLCTRARSLIGSARPESRRWFAARPSWRKPA